MKYVRQMYTTSVSGKARGEGACQLQVLGYIK